MCSEFIQSMENYKGDLTDIIRGSSGGSISSSSNTTTSDKAIAAVPGDHWQFPSNPTNYSSGIDERLDYFGDPFSNTRDPLLHGGGIAMPPSSGFFPSPTNIANTSDGRGNTNIFSTMLQISSTAKLPVSPVDSPALAPTVSPRLKSPTTLISNELMINSTNSKSCLVENSGLQISSPRNTGIKRRKSQAKKVVCIPAPAPANSRQTGEVVPSDLWAWRKYGQKPIKGSPYPRGYYRCSSSKGCSARKQVERSRTDPNMLVITYTSEHNHPWPTQRNALAGSSRSQPVKNNNSAPKTSSSSASQPQNQKVNNTLKDEENERNGDNPISSSPSPIVPTKDPLSIKEEMEDVHHKSIEMEDVEFGYKPSLMLSSNSADQDFFADLGEIEADPLNLLFNRGFSSGDDGRINKSSLDPFTFYDWPAAENNNSSTSNNVNSNTTLIGGGEAKKI